MSMSKGVTAAVEKICAHFGLKHDEVVDVVTAKAKKTKKTMIVKPTTLIPFLGAVEGWCDGLKLNHGLYSQCTNKPMSTGVLCKTCEKQAAANEHGKPNCGLASERAANMEMWRDPKNKAPSAFGNVFSKLKLDRVTVVDETARVFGLAVSEIADELFEEVKAVRGRPKKVNPVVSDTESEGEAKVAAKKRGRPKKASKGLVGKMSEGEDLIATLVAQAQAAAPSADVQTSDDDVSNTSESEVEQTETVDAKAAAPKKAKKSDAEKEAAKAAKLAEKEAAKAAKLAEKEAAKIAKLAEKEAAKAAKLAEKKAAKAAEKAAAKVAKEEEAASETSDAELTVEDAVNDDVEVVDKVIGGVLYLVDDEGIVYDKATQQPVGTWNEADDCVDECEFEEPEMSRTM